MPFVIITILSCLKVIGRTRDKIQPVLTFSACSLTQTHIPMQAIPAPTEITRAIRTAGPTGMQAAAVAQEATTTRSSMEVTFLWVIPRSVILW